MNNRSGLGGFLLLITLALAACAQQETTPQPPLPYAITNHDLKIGLDLDQHAITATDRISLARQTKRPEMLELLLRKGLTISGIAYAGQQLDFRAGAEADPHHFDAIVDSEDVSYYARTQVIQIPITEAMTKAKQIQLDVFYAGTVEDSTAGADFSREYVTDQITGVVDNRGIFLGAEAIYYPSLPGQLFTYSLEVTTPQRFQCITEGDSKETVLQAGKRTESWDFQHPIDAFHVVGGQYQVNSIDYDGVTISTYFFPEQADLSARYLEACKQYIDLYSGLLGPYPFKKFAVVDNFFASGYGMPSFTLLGSQVLRLPWIISTSLGHEICHNWWGNSVYVNYELGNWCEGLTTYCADYFYKEKESADAARDYRIGILGDYTAYTNQGNDFPLSQFRERHNPAQRAVGYDKSAMLFHMLRTYVGDDDFWRSLKRFYRDNVWTHASWEEVRKAFEKESAMKLQWFFDQWVNRTGAPLLEIQNAQKKSSEGAWEFSFALLQAQDGEAYVLDVPIVAMCEGQAAHLRAGMDQKSQLVKQRTIFEPTSFSVDPDFDVFRRLKPAEVAPTLAEILGKSDLMIVLPSLASPELQDAYGAVARELIPPGANQVQILSDHEIAGEDLRGKALMFLGTPQENQAIPADWLRTDRWRVQDSSYWLLGQDYTDPHASLLAVERPPDDAELPVGFFCSSTAKDALEVGRKLKHYGKYSYLVFSEGTNVAKGNWEVSDSPMTYKF